MPPYNRMQRFGSPMQGFGFEQMLPEPNFLAQPGSPTTAAFMPGWSPPAGAAPAKPVMGEEALVTGYGKVPGQPTAGQAGAAPPQAKGFQPPAPPMPMSVPNYGPMIYNGPNLFGDPNPPPPPSLNQYMSAYTPMMPPAYADVQMEARNNAIQAAGRGRAMDAWTQAMNDYNRLNFDRNTQAADWMLRRDLGMGGLGLQGRRLDLDASSAAFDQKMREQNMGLDRERFAFDRQKYEQGRSPVEQERAMAATLLGSGKSGPEVQTMLDEYRRMFPGSTYGAPPGPGESPGSAKGGPAASTAPPQPVSRGNVFDPFVTDFDKIAGVGTDAAGKQVTTATVGEFLNKLEAAKQPGFVRQNWPAIESYVKSRWGESGFNTAAAPPAFIDYYDIAGITPTLGPLSRWAGGQLGLSEPTKLSDAPWYTWLGGYAPLLKLGAGDTVLPGFQHSDDAIGRSKLRDILKSRAAAR